MDKVTNVVKQKIIFFFININLLIICNFWLEIYD
jgi:hypothetical protein